MLRRSVAALGGGMVPFHDWTLKDPILQNYEGWRVLDNVKVTKWQALVTDWSGLGRHLDPIIDDPRLTHSQRVCRLYHWALKELIMHTVWNNTAKFNLGSKTIRNRFERYRYVTDPAMCDMMVRETQKYLRETCCYPTVFFYDYRWKGQPLQSAENTHFPGNPQLYDHWTDPSVLLFDDAKIHRYYRHNPHNTAPREVSDRFGEPIFGNFTGKAFYRPIVAAFVIGFTVMCELEMHGMFFDPRIDPPHNFKESTDRFADVCMRASYEQRERSTHHKLAASYTNYDWDWVMGKVGNKSSAGNFAGMQLHRLPRSQTEDTTYY